MFKVRCSAIRSIMTSDRSGKGLSITAKSHVEDWYKLQLYGAQKNINSKYLRKGLEQEDAAIELVADYYGKGILLKNEDFYENDFLTGTPDVICSGGKEIRDTKCSWDAYTFPLLKAELPSKDYYWQMQGYMALTGAQVAYIDYVLMNSLPEEIERSTVAKYGEDYTEEDYTEVNESMTYDRHPMNLRIKTFEVQRCDEDIEKIKERVMLCREYLKTILI